MLRTEVVGVGTSEASESDIVTKSSLQRIIYLSAQVCLLDPYQRCYLVCFADKVAEVKCSDSALAMPNKVVGARAYLQYRGDLELWADD